MFTLKQYADGQWSASIEDDSNLLLKIRANSYEELFKIASIKEAWDYRQRSNAMRKSRLELYCLIGQRSDRRFNENQSFDLRIISSFINQMNFDEVAVFHPHSSVVLALIHRSESIDHFSYVKQTFDLCNKPLLISPDAGAYKETHRISEKLGADLIPANKVRVDNEPKIVIQGDVNGKDCLIVDDIADGGRTFMHLAKALKNDGAQKVSLYVSHAQFNYGFDDLAENIDLVFCTNSFRDIEHPMVHQFKILGLLL